MTRHVLASLATLALVLGLAIQAPAQEGSTSSSSLRWSYEEGDAWSYRLTQVQDVSAQVMGQSMDQGQTQTTDITLEVAEVAEDGTATLEWTYDRIQVEAEAMGMNMSWDSENPEAGGEGPDGGPNPMAAGFSALESIIGRTITVRVATRGDVEDVQGLEAIREALLQDVDPSIRPMMEQQFGTMFGEESIRAAFMGGLGVFPEGDVSPGSTWDADTQMDVPMLGTIRTGITNTVDEISTESGERRASISQEGVVSFEASDEPGRGPMAGMNMDVELEEGAMSGAVTFSIDRGILVHSETEQDLDMSMSMQGGRQGGMEMSQSVTSTTTFELLGPAEAGSDGERPQTGGGDDRPRTGSGEGF